MKITKKGAVLLGVLGLVIGIAGTAALQSYAATDSQATSTATADMSAARSKQGGHAPLGGDGNVTAINGNLITMQEEADEGGGLYTVDAGSAAITNNGAAAGIADIKVGDKIFVQGTVNGNNVAATAISLGCPGGHGYRK